MQWFLAIDSLARCLNASDQIEAAGPEARCPFCQQQIFMRGQTNTMIAGLGWISLGQHEQHGSSCSKIWSRHCQRKEPRHNQQTKTVVNIRDQARVNI